ncbi:acid protease [Polychaeton citri CBS 116435]|uniref:Acid protease n=1 Tax=Polychaeton citri CBS 116435 TaxID=1314669 RepID=A0A9P4Q9S9_9PEZI|nr:acid protease [Polychaeton citri CBS 116435]
MLLSGLLLDLSLTSSIAHARSNARRFQQPLQSFVSHNEAVDTLKGRPVTDGWARWFQTTNITAGTPPQSFRAAINIGWTDMMLPNVDCPGSRSSTSQLCEEATNMYNASASSTNNNDTGRDESGAERLCYSQTWRGKYTNDAVSVGGVQLDNVTFISASSIDAYDFMDLFDFDAVLGLPRYPNSVRRGIDQDVPPGPFHQMIQEGTLERNIFSLKLAQNSGAEDGQLLFGEIDHSQYVGPLVTLPISSIDREVEVHDLPSSWHVALHEISVGDSSASWPTVPTHAVFNTIDPFFFFPDEFTDKLLEQIDADLSAGIPGVDCDKRGSMPDILFTFGPDRITFALTAWQYIVELDATPEDESGCYAPFFSFRDILSLPGEHEAVILGAQFLRSFYSVFDFDNDEISLAYTKQPDDEQTRYQRRYWQAPM